MDEGCCDVVLGRKGVAARYVHIRSACCKHLAEVGCLCLQMDGEGYLEALKWLLEPKFPFQCVQKGHVILDPFNF